MNISAATSSVDRAAWWVCLVRCFLAMSFWTANFRVPSEKARLWQRHGTGKQSFRQEKLRI